MKLTKENIQYIDRWLQFSGIEYIDVRYELVDHLVTEYEELDHEEDLEAFVKERLNWCRLTAKKKEKTMHWGIQKSLWKRVFKVTTNAKSAIPLLLYVGVVFIWKDELSARTVRFLFLAPVFLTIVLFIHRSIFKSFSRQKRKRVLAMTKLGTLFALPQLFFTIFYVPSFWSYNPSEYWNPYFLASCAIVMTVINFAAVKEYDILYERIVKEYKAINESFT